jgi:hypothetical protein
MNSTQYFTNIATLEALTKERNRLARLHHPDLGGRVEVMQEVNAQFEAAKKRLSAPPAQRVWVRPQGEPPKWQDIDDMLSRMKGWAKAKEETRQTDERQQARAEVDKQRSAFKADLQNAYWTMHMAEIKEGLFKNCQVHYKAGEFLKVAGNTFPYKEWFKARGFRWNAEERHWYFHKKPLRTEGE